MFSAAKNFGMFATGGGFYHITKQYENTTAQLEAERRALQYKTLSDDKHVTINEIATQVSREKKEILINETFIHTVEDTVYKAADFVYKCL